MPPFQNIIRWTDEELQELELFWKYHKGSDNKLDTIDREIQIKLIRLFPHRPFFTTLAKIQSLPHMARKKRAGRRPQPRWNDDELSVLDYFWEQNKGPNGKLDMLDKKIQASLANLLPNRSFLSVQGKVRTMPHMVEKPRRPNAAPSCDRLFAGALFNDSSVQQPVNFTTPDQRDTTWPQSTTRNRAKRRNIWTPGKIAKLNQFCKQHEDPVNGSMPWTSVGLELSDLLPGHSLRSMKLKRAAERWRERHIHANKIVSSHNRSSKRSEKRVKSEDELESGGEEQFKRPKLVEKCIKREVKLESDGEEQL